MRSKKIYKKRYLLFLLLVLAGLSLVFIPNRSGILKAINFWDREWIDSTSGALFETQGQAFIARIGNKSDPKQIRLSYTLASKEFTLEMIKNTVTPITPSPLPTSEISTESAQINAAIDMINSNVSEVESQALTISGDTTQSFFGPHETIRQNQIFGGSLSYYLANNSLNEEWQIVDKTDQISFLFTSKDVFLKVTPDGKWTMQTPENKIVTIETLLTAADGTSTAPIYNEEKTIPTSESGQQVVINIPVAWQDDYEKKFPVKMTRIYTSANTQSTSEDASEEKYSTTSDPASISTFEDKIIVADPTNQTISMTSKNANEILLSSLPVTYISCNTEVCYVSANSDIYMFDPIKIKQEPDMEKRIAQLTLIKTGYPIGGIATTHTDIYATNNSNPNGTLFILDRSEKISNIRENLTYPTTISIAPDGKIQAMFINGQIQYQTSSDTWKNLNLNMSPKQVAAGNDKTLYFITEYPRTHEDIIVRINVENSTVEVLAKVSGKFTTLLPTKDILYLTSSTQNSGWVWPISMPESRWVSITEFTAQ